MCEHKKYVMISTNRNKKQNAETDTIGTEDDNGGDDDAHSKNEQRRGAGERENKRPRHIDL